jgi:hypothetical protein
MTRVMGKSVVTAVIALLATTTATPAHADPAFTCTYSFLAWHGGFSADLDIANNGPMVDGWTAHLTFPSATAGLQAWQAIMSQNTPYDATATNMSWNAQIPAGRVVSFGWTATAATTGPPAAMSVNGVAC